MKLDFTGPDPIGGTTGGGGGAAPPLPRRTIDRRMRQLDVEPLDRSNRVVRVGVIVGLLCVLLFAAFALVAPVSSAAIAPGEVSVAGDKVAIQPVGGGIVTRVLVREGQQVAAGQPLIGLNGVRSGGQLRQAQARADALLAQEARLIAEQNGRALAFPAALVRRGGDPVVANAMAAERRLFVQRQAMFTADRATSVESLAAARAQHAAAARQLALITDELRDYRELYAKGFARKTTIRSLERNQAQLIADRAAGLASVNQAAIARNRVADAQAMERASQLNAVRQQLAQVMPQLDTTRYVADQDVLRAPAAGRVSGLTAIGPGMVLSAGRTVMEIVPSGRALLIDAQVSPADIDDVKVGQIATVRFATVNPHGATTFDGRVVTLSPARIAGPNGQGYFRAQIELVDPAALRAANVALRPGIPASVTIRTQERTIFDYIFAPLSDAVSRSFRQE